MKASYILISAMAIALVSCKKDSNGGGSGNSATQVVIDFPTPGQIVFNGANLRMEGTITDNDILTNISVQVRNKTTGAVLYSAQTVTSNVSFFRYTYNWTVSGVSASMIATVKITGRDINGGEGFKEVDITLEP